VGEQRPTGSGERWPGPGRFDAANGDRVAHDGHPEPSGDQRQEQGATAECRCEVRFRGDRLLLDAENCPGAGRLADNPACRGRAIGALAERDARAVCIRITDTERTHACGVAAFLVAAGRFVALCDSHNAALAARARRHPLEAARAAAGRDDPVARIAAETGFIEGSVRFASYRDAFGESAASDDPGDRDPRNRSDPGGHESREGGGERR